MQAQQTFLIDKPWVSQEAKQLTFLLLAVSNVVLLLMVLLAGLMEAKKSHYLVHSGGTPERAAMTNTSSTAKAESMLRKTDAWP